MAQCDKLYVQIKGDNMTKRIKEIHLYDYSYYEYDNGIKVYYRKTNNAREYKMFINFLFTNLNFLLFFK